MEMKKGLFLISMLLVLMFTSAFADTQITFPNGLKFGMTFDEAVAVSGYSINDFDIHKAEIKGYGMNSNAYINGRAVVGGKDVGVEVYFNDNKLAKIIYTIFYKENTEKHADYSGSIKESGAIESYYELEEKLYKKYGPELDSEKSKHAFQGLFLDYKWTVSGKNYEIMHIDNDRTTRKVNTEDGGCIYIDNYTTASVRTENGGNAIWREYHCVAYTYYDFQINDDVLNAETDF